MKRTICIVSSCITLAVLMMVQTFAISRFDAYSYWANAQNQVSFIGNDIINYFNYSKSTGLNPPSSIQSDFYKNGYYSNNIALFNQHSGGTASFDLNSLQPVYSWTYNGIDGTSPLDNGFEVTGSATVTLIDSCARIGPYNGTTGKTIRCDTSDQIAVYDFRVKHANLSDATNFSRIYIGFTYNGSPRAVCLTFNKTEVAIGSYTHYYNTGFGVDSKFDVDFSTFRDCRFIIEGETVSFYIDGTLYRSFTADGDDSTTVEGVLMGTWKYANLDIYSYSFKTFANPTTTVIVSLGRSVLIPAGDDMEFYVHLRNGSVTNVTTQITVDLDFSLISQMTLILNEQMAMVPIEYDDDWLYVKVPSADVDRILSYCYFTARTPYVNTTTGDQLRWDMEMAFSDLVFGDPDDIGLNPDIDPEQDKFRNEVLGGINDVKQEIHDGFDIINGTIEDVRQEVQNGFDMVEDALSRDDTFDDVPAWSEADIENVIPESDALIQYEHVMANAYQTLEDANIRGAQSWWQNLYTVILTIPMAGMMAVIVSSLLILRSLLGR